ncbi:MAG: MarR family transcriptional regulator [Parvibaculaceae bacterium]
MTDKKAAQPSDAASLVFTFFNEIGIIAQLSGTALRRALPDGMTQAQFGVLNHFARLGGERTPAELATAFQVTKGAMTNTLQRLEANGLITVQTDPADKRRKIVKATAKGLKTRETTLASVAPLLTRVAQDLPLADLEAALPTLRQVRAYLDTARNEPE